MEAGEGGGDGWGVREGRGGEKGRKLYLNDNKIRKYLTKKKKNSGQNIFKLFTFG